MNPSEWMLLKKVSWNWSIRFATAKTANMPENMQGFHEDHMLFVVDEASGVADPIMEANLASLYQPLD